MIPNQRQRKTADPDRESYPAKNKEPDSIDFAEEADIFVEFHAPALGLLVDKKTRDAISKIFYWPGMSADIDL